MAVSKNQYLEAKVLTAPSHELHLMLIDAAIRSGRQAEGALQRGDMLAAGPPLMRAIEIMEELLAGVRHSKTELNKKIADFYLFLFRTLSEAKINDDVVKLSEALKLLEFERETWQLVCDKLAANVPSNPPRPIAMQFGDKPSAASSSFSFEA